MKTRFFPAILICLLLPVLPWNGTQSWWLPGCPAGTPQPRLLVRAEVKAAQNRVNLLDLCDGESLPANLKDLMAQEDIGEAPAPGARKYIDPVQLRAYLDRFFSSRGHDPSAFEIVLPERIAITRQAFQPTREEIEVIYREYILSRTSWDPKNLQISGIHFAAPPELPTGVMSYEVSCATNERFLGNVGVTIQFFIDGERQRGLRVTGKVDLYLETIHALHPLDRNTVITESDIGSQRVNVGDTPDRFATTAGQVVGKRLLRDVGLQQPIMLSDLDAPLAFKRGSIVTILYDEPGLKLTAKGQAREDGRIGDTIRVVNVRTNRTLVCRVIDDTTVAVTP